MRAARRAVAAEAPAHVGSRFQRSVPLHGQIGPLDPRRIHHAEGGAGRFRAFSAGSHPQGVVNPIALEVLESSSYPTDALRSKSWDEFAAPDAPLMDFVFTVCDAAVEGTDIQKEAAFVLAARYLRNRISVFASLPLRSIDPLSLDKKLKEIGALEGASKPRSEPV